jgi:L,D-peptidoglycan transpeptidase YkuD (ErfK/YbiS/YcfS/YnhG family)
MRLRCSLHRVRSHLRQLLLFSVAAIFITSYSRAADLPWHDAQQLVLVTTADWDANQGSLQMFAFKDGRWQPVAGAVAISIGRAGSAWGTGLHAAQPGPAKREGDGRSPAGVFRIGEAFGYAPSVATALHYAAMSESDYCVDVATSPLYNRIVDARKVGAATVAGSTEPMRRDIHVQGDQRYKLGFVIEHNPNGTPAAGSCIFAHLWKAPGEPTSGCTAMAEPVMRQLIAWLQPAQHPVFILLPQPEYARLKAPWQLPDLPQ